MAETDLFGEVGGQLLDKAFSGILIFGIVILIICLIAGFIWYFGVYRKKFDIKVKIISNRAEEKNSILFDKAAILKDLKNQLPYFRVWGLKKDFPVPKYNVLQKSDKGDYLEIYRDSEDRFYFLRPVRINKKYIIRADGKRVRLAEQEQTASDPEMDFWRVKRKGINKRMFDTESILMKILPYVPQIIGGVITIFVLYILMDTLPGVLSSLQELVESLNVQQRAEVVTG